jgi:hypothetical protein
METFVFQGVVVGELPSAGFAYKFCSPQDFLPFFYLCTLPIGQWNVILIFIKQKYNVFS